MAKLPCLLAHFDQSVCPSTEETFKIYIVPSLLTLLARLLDGKEDEVTPLVRHKTYDALTRAIMHHDHRTDERLDHVADMILRGMADQDRSVRLSAGYDS